MVFQKHCVHKHTVGKFYVFDVWFIFYMRGEARRDYTFKWWSADSFFLFEIVACDEELDWLCEGWERKWCLFSQESFWCPVFIFERKTVERGGILLKPPLPLTPKPDPTQRSEVNSVRAHTCARAQGVCVFNLFLHQFGSGQRRWEWKTVARICSCNWWNH